MRTWHSLPLYNTLLTSAALTFQTKRPTIGTERKDYGRDASEGERKSAQIQLKPQYPCRQMQPTIE